MAMEEGSRRPGFASDDCESRKARSCARRACTKMPVLAHCFCIILSIGTVRSSVQASSKGFHLLTPALAHGGPQAAGPWVHSVHLEGPRVDDGEDATDGWIAKGLRKSPAGEFILPFQPLAALTEAAGEDREAITDLLSGSPWALVSVRQYPGGKRHTLSFTPRMGRDSGEERDEEEALLEMEGEDGEGGEGQDEDEEGPFGGGIIVRRRTPPFAPRLGRRSPEPAGARSRVVPFAPRLGKRRVRGGTNGEEVQSPTSGNPERNLIFSPRLGRSPMQTRSGEPRSGSDGRAHAEEGETKEV